MKAILSSYTMMNQRPMDSKSKILGVGYMPTPKYFCVIKTNFNHILYIRDTDGSSLFAGKEMMYMDHYFEHMQECHDFQEKYYPELTIEHLSLNEDDTNALNIWYSIVECLMAEC